jgi:hypothetical protein
MHLSTRSDAGTSALTENFTSVCNVADLSGVAILCVKYIPREKVILAADVDSLFRGEVAFDVSSINCSKALRAYRVKGPIAILAMRKRLTF